MPAILRGLPEWLFDPYYVWVCLINRSLWLVLSYSSVLLSGEIRGFPPQITLRLWGIAFSTFDLWKFQRSSMSPPDRESTYPKNVEVLDCKANAFLSLLGEHHLNWFVLKIYEWVGCKKRKLGDRPQHFPYKFPCTRLDYTTLAARWTTLPAPLGFFYYHGGGFKNKASWGVFFNDGSRVQKYSVRGVSGEPWCTKITQGLRLDFVAVLELIPQSCVTWATWKAASFRNIFQTCLYHVI